MSHSSRGLDYPERSRLSPTSFTEISRTASSLDKVHTRSRTPISLRQPAPFSISAFNWATILLLISALVTTISILTPYWIQNDIEPSLAKVGLWIKCAAWRGDERYQVIKEGNRHYVDVTNTYRADLSGECGFIFGTAYYPGEWKGGIECKNFGIITFFWGFSHIFSDSTNLHDLLDWTPSHGDESDLVCFL